MSHPPYHQSALEFNWTCCFKNSGFIFINFLAAIAINIYLLEKLNLQVNIIDISNDKDWVLPCPEAEGSHVVTMFTSLQDLKSIYPKPYAAFIMVSDICMN